MKDPLPSYLIEDNNLMEYRDAIKNIHFPKDKHTFDIARRRLSYNEFLFFILRLRILKLTEEESVSTAVMKKSELVDRFLEKLPYDLTDAQKRVYKEIEADLTGSRVMNRLIQGDVGSGKTILAFLALLITVENGYQGAMMAPTEVLARQHYEDICNMAKEYDLPFRPVLMIGSLKAKEKKENKKGIEDGTYNVCIGTNALIQDTVNYKNLALVITDEQHRFGVRQREKFAGKGECTHVLAMSATPIPRTLAIILYGDLHVSVLDEKPASRLPIKNCVVGPDYRPTAYRFIEKQVSLGHQVYVICPMIEEGEMNDVENVTDYTEKLRKELSPSIHVDMLNGRMKASEKDELMEKFANKEIDVLVSTTVIEVGINVPNATVMMIENAEHFGLAQLHQLRGRVGRGKDQSYCIFMNTSESKDAAARLDILGKSNDGFKIAEEDLKQRGPGDMFGIRQSGDLFFKIGDIYADSDLIKKASIDADRILGDDPDLCKKENEALHKALAGANETIVL
jgi:ATP-dependent DNA helicase RecG